jgi:hypothetical protein
MYPSAAELDEAEWLLSPSAQSIATRALGYACTGCPCWRLRRKRNQKEKPPIAAAVMVTTACAVG